MKSPPHAVDVHVGAKIRQRRKEIGLSQHALARGIGVTFQQVQKYEHGSNRISASKLFEAAQVLGVPVRHFYEGVEANFDSPDDDSGIKIRSYLATPEGAELANLMRMLSPRRRKGVLALVRAIAVDEDER